MTEAPTVYPVSIISPQDGRLDRNTPIVFQVFQNGTFDVDQPIPGNVFFLNGLKRTASDIVLKNLVIDGFRIMSVWRDSYAHTNRTADLVTVYNVLAMFEPKDGWFDNSTYKAIKPCLNNDPLFPLQRDYEGIASQEFVFSPLKVWPERGLPSDVFTVQCNGLDIDIAGGLMIECKNGDAKIVDVDTQQKTVSFVLTEFNALSAIEDTVNSEEQLEDTFTGEDQDMMVIIDSPGGSEPYQTNPTGKVECSFRGSSQMFSFYLDALSQYGEGKRIWTFKDGQRPGKMRTWR
jgi:hypothetical protein